MADPTEFEPLTIPEQYEAEWDSAEGYNLQDGQTFEHVHVNMPNGYLVSLARTNMGDDWSDETIGYEDGKWEAALMRQASPLYTMLTGRYGVPAPELDDLTTDTIGEGPQTMTLVGNLDQEGVNNLLATVAARPAYEGDPDEDPFSGMFAGLGDFAPAEDTTGGQG